MKTLANERQIQHFQRMFKLKPLDKDTFTCPACGTLNPAQGLRFLGVPVVTKITCKSCNQTFNHTLPFGHFKHFPLAFSSNKPQQLSNPTEVGEWLYKGWLLSYYEDKKAQPEIEKRVFKSYREVIILPCLDRVYGHSLWRLLNVSQLLKEQAQKGIILLVPSYLEWLIPEGIAEAWIVHIRPEESLKHLQSLEVFAQKELKRFEQVWLAETSVQPIDFDIEIFTKVSPFPQTKFKSLPLNITLIWREDRLWLRQFWEHKYFGFIQRFSLPSFYLKILQNQQVKRFKRLINCLKRVLPEASINLIGLGKSGNFSQVKDLRSKTTPDTQQEQKWVKLYAQSQVVFGIHGAHL